MSVDSEIKLLSNPSVKEIVEVLKQNPKFVKILGIENPLKTSSNFYRVGVDYKNSEGEVEKRSLSIGCDYIDDKQIDELSFSYTKGKPYTSISLNCSNSYKEILMYIISYFGGYFIDNDVDPIYEKIKKTKQIKIKQESKLSQDFGMTF